MTVDSFNIFPTISIETRNLNFFANNETPLIEYTEGTRVKWI